MFLRAEGNIIQLHLMKKVQKYRVDWIRLVIDDYFFWQLQSRDLIICTVTTKMIISPLSPGYLMVFPPRKLFCALLGFQIYYQGFVNRPNQAYFRGTTKYRETALSVCTVNYRSFRQILSIHKGWYWIWGMFINIMSGQLQWTSARNYLIICMY